MKKNEARIYQPTKTATQSGWAKTQAWILEFEPSEARRTEPLMGWISSGDTSCQVKLRFSSKEEAIKYAERENLTYQVMEPKRRRIRPKSYADNFSYKFRFD